MRLPTLLFPAIGISLSCCGRSPQQGSLLHPVEAIAHAPNDSTIALRFDPPKGFERAIAPAGSFGAYLQQLPLKPARSSVRLYNGGEKARQDIHAAVVDLSVGAKDLQQCADAILRLRAEYLFAGGRQDEIAFPFTSGFLAEWKRWRGGERIRVEGNTCSWIRGARPDASHAELLRFLDLVFTYAGSLSLQRELDRSTPTDMSSADLRIGDVFIQGGSPGHAMIVVDVARATDGRTAFLLAQSYMPAQEVHVVKNAHHPELGAWYLLEGDALLRTPEWTFEWGDRRRWP